MRAALLVFVGVTAVGLAAEPAPPPTWETKPEVAGILAGVPPLKQPLGSFHPTLYWWQAPLSFDDPAKLKQELQGLADRGLSPCIGLEAEPNVAPATIAKRIAEAKAVARAGFPVNIQMIGVLDLYKLPDGKLVRHADAPGADKKDAVGQEFPCLILQDGWKARAKYIHSLLQKFADAQVPVAAVWYDYEGHPHPWNGIFEHSQQCPSCRQQFPPGVLDNREQFAAWAFDWHTAAIKTAFAQPVRELYPKATLGFYGYAPSSEAHPVYEWSGLRYPPLRDNPQEIEAAMPVCYADTSAAKRYFNADWPVSSQEMDGVYFSTLLRAVSNLHDNLRPDQRLMPFVSSYVSAPGREHVPRMSKPLYREFLRHAILRGARGFYCFNVAPPYGSMADYYAELTDINRVYNELLAQREFFEGGTILTDEWPDPKSAATVWSGIRKGDQALIRVVTLQSASQMIDIVPFPGVAVRLLAPSTGATYVVARSGSFRAVE